MVTLSRERFRGPSKSNEGHLDLATANFGDHCVTILHNDGMGAFPTSVTLDSFGAARWSCTTKLLDPVQR